MARVLVGVTGGIAAYKACELIRLLVVAGHDVLPIPTRSAERFVAPETLYALARVTPPGRPVPAPGQHADLLVVAPLTANTLARLAHGLADDLLTEAALAHAGPTLVAPAMNTRMWLHPATQANLETLLGRGVQSSGPATGELAEGEVGIGRMAEPEEIAHAVAELLDQTPGRVPSLTGRSRRRECGWHPRAARRCAVPRQSLLRADGGRGRGRRPRPGCERHAARREPRRACSGRCRGRRSGRRRRSFGGRRSLGSTPT